MAQEVMYINLQKQLNEDAKKYLSIIEAEYGKYMSEQQIMYLQKLKNMDPLIIVELNTEAYENNQFEEIDSDVGLTSEQKQFEKESLLRNMPLAHGARVYNDDKIHFYPSTLKD